MTRRGRGWTVRSALGLALVLIAAAPASAIAAVEPPGSELGTIVLRVDIERRDLQGTAPARPHEGLAQTGGSIAVPLVFCGVAAFAAGAVLRRKGPQIRDRTSRSE